MILGSGEGTSQDCLGNSSPGYTNKASYLGSFGHYWSMMCPSHQWRQWRGESVYTFANGSAYLAVWAVQLCTGRITSCNFHLTSHSREALQYRDSNDPKVSTAGIKIHTGRKWSATRERETAEARLWHKAIMGAVATRGSSFGSFPLPQYNNAQGKERWLSLC